MNTMSGADPTKVSGRRFGAFLIDWVLLCFIVPFALALAVANLTVYTDGATCGQLEAVGAISTSQPCIETGSTNDPGDTVVFDQAGIIVYVVLFLAYVAVVMGLVQALTGATAGKLLFGIRTVDADGNPPGIGRQLIRGLLWLPALFVTIVPIISAVTILVSKRHQRLGDMAAGTFVVRATARGIPVPPVTSGSATTIGYNAAGIVPTTAPMTPSSSSSVYPAGPPMTAPAPDFSSHTDPTAIIARPTDPTIADPTTVVPHLAAETSAPNGGPQWDPARNAYIQWDQARQSWLAYDDAAGEWKPIS